MSFAQYKAASDGELAVLDSRAETLVKASRGGGISELMSGAGNGRSIMALNRSAQNQSRSREAYAMLRNWIDAAVNCIATRVAAQPWQAGHYKPKTKEKQRRAFLDSKGYDRRIIPKAIRHKGYGTDIETDEEHPVLWSLEKPNGHQGKSEFLQITVMNLLLTGEYYWIGGLAEVKDLKGKKETKFELWAVPSSWIVPDHSQGLFGGYNLVVDGTAIPLPRENVARGYLPDPSDVKSCRSRLVGCASAARIDEYILKSQKDAFERGINPNLVVSIGKSIGEDGKQTTRRPVLSGRQRTQIIRAVKQVWNQTVGQGDPAIIDGLIEDIKKLQATPQEMDWQQSAMGIKARIMQAFMVNPIVLGEVTPANKAQAVVAEEQVCRNAVNPIVENISCVATEFVSPFFDDGETLAAWLEQSVPADDEMAFRKMQFARQNEDITQDEFRAYLSMPPVAEEDKPPDRSPMMNNPQTLAQIATLCGQVSQGAMSHDNAVAILVTTLRVSEEDAEAMIPDDPPEPPPMPEPPPGQPPGAPQGPPQAGEAPEAGQGEEKPPPGKPAVEKPKDEEEDEPAKGYNPDQPRDDRGRFGEGGGGGDRPISDFKSFKSGSAAEKALASSAEQWSDEDTTDYFANKDIKEYAGTSDSFRINDCMRKECGDKRLNDVADRLDARLAKTSFPEDVQASRAINPKTPEEREAILKSFKDKLGQDFTDPAFVSTTANKKYADDWAKKMGTQPPIKCTVLVPKGAKAAYLPKTHVGKQEWEVLIQRGSSFRVREVSDDGNVVLELL